MSSSQWRDGLITVTAASQIIIGTASCDWVNQVSVGHTIKVDRDNESTYIVGNILSATRMYISSNYTGDTGSGLSYMANRSFSSARNYWRCLQGDFDFAEILSQDTIDKIDTDINNIITGNASIDGTKGKVFKINANASAARLHASWLTASRDYTFPDQNATLAGLGVAQTFTANQTVDASLWVKGNASIDGDLTVGGNLTVDKLTITSSILGNANASIDGDLTVGGNISGDTYGSDGSVSDAELLYIGTLSSNAQTQLTDNSTNITRANASIDALQDNVINANASIAINTTNITAANASIDALQNNIINVNASITEIVVPTRSQVAKTASYQLVASNLTGFKTFTNTGAVWPINFRWASPMVIGQGARFLVTTTSGATPLKITAPSLTNHIRYLGVTATYIRTATVDRYVELEAAPNGINIIDIGGPWNYDR